MEEDTTTRLEVNKPNIRRSNVRLFSQEVKRLSGKIDRITGKTSKLGSVVTSNELEEEVSELSEGEVFSSKSISGISSKHDEFKKEVLKKLYHLLTRQNQME